MKGNTLTGLADILAPIRLAPACEIPPSWLQGRTAYGGLSAAVALAAVQSAQPDLPPLRSAQIAFVGPLSGTVRAEPALLRRGRNSGYVACDLTGPDGLGLRALFLFMTTRPSTIEQSDLPAPPAPAPGGSPVPPHPMTPGFLANFEMSTALDPTPGRFLRWVRLRDRDDAVDPAVALVAIADALPPAALSLATVPGPISTTTWQLNMLVDSPATTDGWWLLEARALHTADGTSSQTMSIWAADGTPAASAIQSVALFT